MAILSLDGTGTNLLEIFFRDAQKSMLTYMMVEALARAYEKPQGKCDPELQVLGARLEAHGQMLSRGSTVKAAGRPPHSKVVV
jgi:hypothetical protein